MYGKISHSSGSEYHVEKNKIEKNKKTRNSIINEDEVLVLYCTYMDKR